MRLYGVRLATFLTIAFLPAVAQAQLPPTEFEQYQLELINRARANPNAEVTRLSGLTWGDTGSPATPNLNEGLAAGTISSAAKQPLAFNTRLIQSAGNYSNTLLANDAFTHTFGGTTPQGRMTAAGYTFSGSFANGENIAVSASSGSFAINQQRVQDQYNGLFVDGNVGGRGHRLNLMNASYREVGIGIRAAGGYDLFASQGLPNANAIISTQDFAFSSAPNSGPFITGVAYRDLITDNFYTPGAGEALGGLSVNVFLADTNTLIGTTTTFASGGYGISVANGTYDVQFVGSGFNSLIENVTVSSLNVKVDFTPVPEPTGVLAISMLALAGWRWRTRCGTSR